MIEEFNYFSTGTAGTQSPFLQGLMFEESLTLYEERN